MTQNGRAPLPWTRTELWAIAAIGVITAWRIVVLAFNKVDLFVDESQYWLWGQELAFGYFSKPPLVGWVIRASNEFGQSDAAFWVRLPAQILHGVTGVLIAILARDIWQSPKATWAGLAFATLPGISVLALFMSTDDVLLPACALTLIATHRLQQAPSVKWAVVLGCALGLGVMAKYAMLFYAALILCLQVFKDYRISRRDLFISLGFAGLIVAPNAAWNFANGFITLSHTADNAGWQGINWNWSGLGAFLGTQVLAFGVVLGPAFVIAIFARSHARFWLLWFCLPIFFAISLQAFVEAANGNWAAPAFISGTVLVSCWLVTHAPRLFFAGLALNAIVALALPLTTVWPDQIKIGDNLVYARALKMSGVSARILATAADLQAVEIVASERHLLADLVYVAKNQPYRVSALPRQGAPQSHYELSRPASRLTGRTLFVGWKLPQGCAGQSVALIPSGIPAAESTAIAKIFLIREPCW